MTQLELDVTEVHHLNREELPCEGDPEYNIARCMEDHVEEAVGCKSPWDAYPPISTEVRGGGEEGEAGTRTHVKFRLLPNILYSSDIEFSTNFSSLITLEFSTN